MNNLSKIQVDSLNEYDGESVLTLYPSGVVETQTNEERLKQIKKSQVFDLLKIYINDPMGFNVEAITNIVNAI